MTDKEERELRPENACLKQNPRRVVHTEAGSHELKVYINVGFVKGAVEPKKDEEKTIITEFRTFYENLTRGKNLTTTSFS